MKRHLLIVPDHNIVQMYINKFNNDESCDFIDKTIHKLIQHFPKNLFYEDILIKVTVINRLYNSGVLDVDRMSRHILSLKVDTKIYSGAIDLVNEIASNHGIKRNDTNREIYFYSFATKYCNWHNKDKFPIYDSFVGKIINEYNCFDKFLNFKKDDLRNYSIFNAAINGFMGKYSLNNFSYKEIDKFLWLYGKEIFPN